VTIDDSLAVLRPLCSPYVGIVRTLEACLPAADEPRLFRYAAEAAQGEHLLGAPLEHVSGIGGAGFDERFALAAAIGETAERYSVSYVPENDLVLAPAREVPGAVDPARFALFAEAQYETPGFPFQRFTEDTLVRWVRAVALPGRTPAAVPAQLVYLAPHSPDERPIGPSTSSGLACATTREEAVAKALCEVLERDAFMIVWTNRLSLPLLDWSENDEIRRFDDIYFRPTGLRYSAVDLSVFHGVPTVLGIARGPEDEIGALGVGAACAATVEEAWRKALSEAFACRSASRKLWLLDPERTYADDYRDVHRFEEHIALYADHGRAAMASFLDASEEKHAVDDVRAVETDDLVTALAARVEAAGSTAYEVDATSPDIRAAGLHVAKVLAPELCPLDVMHAARFQGGRRLLHAAHELGLRERPLEVAELNPDPHPFP